MKKAILAMMIAFLLVLIVVGSGCIDSEYDSEYVSPQIDISIEEFFIDSYWHAESGWYADCTITLVNRGDKDGIATVLIETSSETTSDEFDLFVASHSTETQEFQVDVAYEGENIFCELVGQR